MSAPVSIKARPWQAEAYAEVAACAGLPFSRWAAAWCNFAAGDKAHPPRELLLDPPSIRQRSELRTGESVVPLGIRASSADQLMWKRAAALAGIPRQSWILAVLDTAIGVSDLAEQLGRVEVSR